MAKQFRTINDMLQHYYGASGLAVTKTDAPVLTTTTGVFNATYGAQAFSNLNSEANVFAALPKYPWQHSGFRVITAHAGSALAGSISEAGAVPDTIKPTFLQVDVKVAEVAHSFDVSYRQEGLVRTDDAFGTMEQLRPYFAALHKKRINQQLLFDATNAGYGEQHGSFESLDRVTAATALVTGGLMDAGDEDIYGIDRSGASWADAQVSHGSTTDRALTISLIEDMMALIQAAGGIPSLIVTGFDTKWRIISLAQTQVRYQGVIQQNVGFSVGVNGIQTDAGLGFGIKIATIYDVPLLASADVTKDTISRIYVLDTTIEEGTGLPRLGISLLYPTMYFEGGMSAANPNPFIINKFATEGVFYTAGQLVCTFFAAQGSIRDLK